MLDIHMHTTFSPDAESSPEDMINAGVKNNLKVLGISDHYDLDLSSPFCVQLSDLQSYIESVESLKNKFPIELLTGIEVGIQSKTNTPPKGNFDYCIYSVHDVPAIPDITIVEDPWKEYLEEAIDAVDSFEIPGFFGHLDYLRRYTKTHEPITKKHLNLLDELLRKITKNDLGIEINTSGWRYPFNEPHPQPWIIERYIELGGKYITIGSDSHTKDTVGHGTDKAIKLLRSMDVKEIFYCKKGNYRSIIIDK